MAGLLARAPEAQVAHAGSREGEGHEGGEEGRTPFGGVSFSREFTLAESEPRPVGLLLISVEAAVKLTGELKHGEGPVAKFGAKGGEGFDEKAIEEEFKTKYGSVKLSGQFEPGQMSAVELGFATERFELAFAAQASITKPFVVKAEIKLPNAKLEFGGWEFAGQVSGEVAIGIAPNPVLIAEYASGVLATGSAGEGVSVTAVGSGTFGSLAAGAGIGAAAVAWEGLVLYEIGAANIEGERQAVRNEYNNGYARMLAALTSNHAAIRAAHEVETEEERESTDEALAAKFESYLYMNWVTQLAAAENAYLGAEPGPDGARQRDGARFDADEAGSARAIQQVMAFVGSRGRAGMDELRHAHQARYGTDEGTRRQAYHLILRNASLDDPAPTVPLP